MWSKVAFGSLRHLLHTPAASSRHSIWLSQGTHRVWSVSARRAHRSKFEKAVDGVSRFVKGRERLTSPLELASPLLTNRSLSSEHL